MSLNITNIIRQNWKKLILGFVVIIIFGMVAMAVWVLTPYQADETARLAMLSSDKFEISSTRDFIKFQNKIDNLNSSLGVMIYPGGRVVPEAYAPLCRDLANIYGTCVVLKMPLNFAIFAPDKGLEVKREFSRIDSWIIVGHSLGGPAAARFVQSEPSKIDYLVLLGSYSDVNISQYSLQVFSLIGSKDELINKEVIEKNKSNLPSDSTLQLIQGGNHAQMGSYGIQQGDGVAEISPEKQRAEVVGFIQYMIQPVSINAD